MSIDAWKRDLEITIERESAKVANEVLAESNRLTPVRTGFLRSRNQLRKEGRNWILFNDAPYSAFRYFGTSRSAGVRWFEQAISLVLSRRGR